MTRSTDRTRQRTDTPLLIDLLKSGMAWSRHAPLPARISAAIAAQQASSEILIGAIQLVIVSVFAVLYLLSPSPAAGIVSVHPEPWFLGAYFGFTLLRLYLAYRRRLPPWLLYLSTILDMALLLALIWSIHIKYGQPASFYLKAPTLLYVFIFISLRALRFDARYVIVAGAVAACGWLLMVLYVVSVDPQDPMITRDYVEYLTSNSVLLGAEFDKVISIVMVTVILAIAITRARTLLERSVTEQQTARELSRFVPAQVVRQATTSDLPMRAGAGEIREATILFADIEAFTAISEQLDPNQLIATLNEYFSVVSEPITRHRGVINQFQGDAILASFNLPDPLPNHAEAALRCALDLQAALGRHRFANGLRLRCRIGINTGEVVGGLVGSGERLGYTVHGETVNAASRLEQLNKQHGTRILVSEETRLAAGAGRFAYRSLGKATIRGLSAPISIHALDEEFELESGAG